MWFVSRSSLQLFCGARWPNGPQTKLAIYIVFMKTRPQSVWAMSFLMMGDCQQVATIRPFTPKEMYKEKPLQTSYNKKSTWLSSLHPKKCTGKNRSKHLNKKSTWLSRVFSCPRNECDAMSLMAFGFWRQACELYMVSISHFKFMIKLWDFRGNLFSNENVTFPKFYLFLIWKFPRFICTPFNATVFECFRAFPLTALCKAWTSILVSSQSGNVPHAMLGVSGWWSGWWSRN